MGKKPRESPILSEVSYKVMYALDGVFMFAKYVCVKCENLDRQLARKLFLNKLRRIIKLKI